MSKRRTKDSRMSQKGFSLVELLISFVLIAILTTGTAQLAVYSLLVKRRADCNLISAELASSLLEYFKSLPYESDELKEGFWKEPAGEEGILGTFWKEWWIQDLSPNMKRIEIESYAESGSQKKIRLALLLSRELGF